MPPVAERIVQMATYWLSGWANQNLLKEGAGVIATDSVLPNPATRVRHDATRSIKSLGSSCTRAADIAPPATTMPPNAQVSSTYQARQSTATSTKTSAKGRRRSAGPANPIPVAPFPLI